MTAPTASSARPDSQSQATAALDVLALPVEAEFSHAASLLGPQQRLGRLPRGQRPRLHGGSRAAIEIGLCDSSVGVCALMTASIENRGSPSASWLTRSRLASAERLDGWPASDSSSSDSRTVRAAGHVESGPEDTQPARARLRCSGVSRSTLHWIVWCNERCRAG